MCIYIYIYTKSPYGPFLGFRLQVQPCTVLSLAGVLLGLRCFHHEMLRWCSLHTVNLGIAQLVAASAMIELLKVPCVESTTL